MVINVNAIKYGDKAYLETYIYNKIFKTLDYIDNDIFKVLVEYYSNVNQNDDIFRPDPRAESQLIDEEETPIIDEAAATKLDDSAVSDSGIAAASEIPKTESAITDPNEIEEINKESFKIYERINSSANKNISKNVTEIINNSCPIMYKNKYDENKVLNVKGKHLLIN